MNYKKKDVDLDRGEGGDLNEDELLFRGLGFSVDDFGLLLTPKSPQQRGGSGSSSALGMLSPEFPSQPNSAIQKPKRTKVFTFDDYDKKAIATETENARIQQNQNSLSSYSEDSDMNCADFSSGCVEPVKPSNPKISRLVPALSLTNSSSLPASAMAALKPESGDWTEPNTSPAGTALIDEKGFHYIPATRVPPSPSSSSHQTSSTLLAAATSPQKPRPALAKKTLSHGNIRTSDFTSVDSPSARQQRTRMMGFPQRRTMSSSSSSSGSGANASENSRGVYIKAERGGPDGGSSSFNSSGNTSIPSKSQPTSNRSSRRGLYEISPMNSVNSVNSVFSQNSIMTGTGADYENDGEGYERDGINEARISDLTKGNSSFMLNERQLSDKSLLSLGQFSVSEFSFGDTEANSARIGTANMPPLSPSRMLALSNVVLLRDGSKRMDTVTEVADELHSGAPSAVNTARHYIPGIALSSDHHPDHHHPLLQEQGRDESTGTASGISTARSIGLSGLERLSLMQQQHHQVAIVGAIDFSACEGSAGVGSGGDAGRVRDAYEGDFGKEGAGITGGSGSRRESERVRGCDEVGVEVGCVEGRFLTEEDTKYDDEIVQMMISDSGSKKTRSSGGVTLLSSDSEKRSSVRPTIIKSLSANSDSSQMSTSSLTSEALLLLEDYALQQERAEMKQAVADADASILYQQAHQYHHHHHQQQQPPQQDQDQDQDQHRELMLMPIAGDGLDAQEHGAIDEEEDGEGFSSYYSYGVVPSSHSHPCSSSPSCDCTRHGTTATVSPAVVSDAVLGSSRTGLSRRGGRGRGRGREAPLGPSSGFTSHEGSFTLVPDSTSSVVATAAAAGATAGVVVIRGGAIYGPSESQAAGPDIMVRAASFTMSKPTSKGFDTGVGLPTRPVSRAESTATSTYSTPHSSQLTSRSNSHSKSEDFVAFYPASQAHSRTNSRSEDSTVIGPPAVSSVASVTSATSGYPFSLLEASKLNSRELSSSCSAQHLPPSIHEHTAYPAALPLPPSVSAKPRPKTSAIQGMGVIGTNLTHSSAAGAVVKVEHLSDSCNNHMNNNNNSNHFIPKSGIRNSSSCPEVPSAVGIRIRGVTADTETGAAMALELKTEMKTEQRGTKTTENDLKDGEGSKGEEGKKVSADEVARASKSLAAISAKFVLHFGENDIFQFLAGDLNCLTHRISAPDLGIPESVRVDAAAESLQVHVRRVYEVIKILEVLSLLSFSGEKRGKFSWLGTRDFLFTLGKLQVDAMSKYPEAAETYGLRKVTSSSGFLPPFEGTRLAAPTPQTQPRPTTSLHETQIQQLQQQKQQVGAVAVLDPEEQLRKTKLHEQAVSTLLFTSMESMDSFIISKSASHSAKHGATASAVVAAAAANMDKRRGGAEGVLPFGAAGSSLNMTRTTSIPMTTIKMAASSATTGGMLQRERSRQSVPQHHHQQRQQPIVLEAGKNNRGQPSNSRGVAGSAAMDTDNDNEEEEEEEEEEYGDCVHPITAEDLMPSRDRDDNDSLAYSAGGRTSHSNSNSRSGGDIGGVPHVKTQHQEGLLFPAAAIITPSLSIIPPDCVGVSATEGSGRRRSSSDTSSAFPPTARFGSALPPSPLLPPHPRDQQAHQEQHHHQQQQRYSLGSVHSSGKSTGSRRRGSGLGGGVRSFERQESSDTAISTEDESDLYNNSPFSRFSHTARTDDSETSEFDQHSNSTSSPARLMPFPRSLPSSYKSHDSMNNSSNKTNSCNSHSNSNDHLLNASSRSSDGSFCGADQSIGHPGPPVARIAARASEIHPFQAGEQSCSVESQGSTGSTGSGSGIAPTVSKLTIESVKQLNLQNLGGHQMNKNNNNNNNNNNNHNNKCSSSAQTSPKAVSGKSVSTVLKIQQRNHLLKSSVGASSGLHSLISNESTGSMSARSAHSAQSVHSLISAQSVHSLISVTSGLSVYTGYSESDLDGEYDPYGIPATAAASGAGAGNGTANESEIMCTGAAVATSAAGGSSMDVSGSSKVGMEGGGGAANRKRNKPTTTPKKPKTTPTGDQHMVESFCKGFLQLFLVGLDGITLSYAIHALVPAKDGQKVEEYNKTNATKIRRIYDVANVLCSLNMMEKRSRPLSGNASSLTAIPLPAHQQMQGKHSNKSDNKALFWCSFPAKAIREAYLRDERSLLPMSASAIDGSSQALPSTQR